MAAFPSTRWSLIHASDRPPGEIAAAWGELVRDYRPAIVGFFRRGGRAADAEDLAQEFLLRSMSDSWWSRADPGVGSFRRFLFVLLNRFLMQHVQSGAQRLEMNQTSVSEDAHYQTPERRFDLDFAICLTRCALTQLRDAYDRDGRADLFDVLQAWLAETPQHGELLAVSGSLGISANTLSVQLKRLRMRFRKTTRMALAQLSMDKENAHGDIDALRSSLMESGAS